MTATPCVFTAYACRYCNFNTSTQRYLILHIKHAHANTLYSCNVCNYLAMNKISLEHHNNYTHQKLRQFILECTHS